MCHVEWDCEIGLEGGIPAIGTIVAGVAVERYLKLVLASSARKSLKYCDSSNEDSLQAILVRLFSDFRVLLSGDVYMKVPFPEVEQEQFASFECLQSGTHKNVRVLKWLFNGAPLPRDTRITSARSPYYNYLQIGTSLPKHSGVYTCVAQDGGEIRNASGKLFVACERTVRGVNDVIEKQWTGLLLHAGPIKPYKQPITKALLGSNISLQCDGECYRYIMWAKNNDYVTSTESERFSSPGNGSILHITNVSLSDNGTFTCDFYLLKMKRAFVQLLVIGKRKWIGQLSGVVR